jgi:hypothetical protein
MTMCYESGNLRGTQLANLLSIIFTAYVGSSQISTLCSVNF